MMMNIVDTTLTALLGIVCLPLVFIYGGAVAVADFVRKTWDILKD